jgi:hypothetical protein
VATQPPAGSPNPTPAAADLRARWLRGAGGYVVGSFAGGLLGWLIDSALTDSPYSGVRIGVFLGGLGGALIGGGAGWLAAAVVLSMVVCAAAGAVVGVLLWNPDPNSFAGLVPSGIGAMVGAFLGLALGAALVRARHKAPTRPPGPTVRP